MTTVIIDYGMGNLASVKRAFEECGSKVFICNDPQDMPKASHLVLPGVGAFSDGMKGLKKSGWDQALKELVLGQKINLLGICLGMQLLADRGFEGRECQGLGIVPGEVVALVPQKEERIPHVGWNEVYKTHSHEFLNEIIDGTDYYFVHSYQFKPLNQHQILLKTPYCGDFVSAVGYDHILGVQFHPEKSSKPGFSLIRSFLNAEG